MTESILRHRTLTPECATPVADWLSAEYRISAQLVRRLADLIGYLVGNGFIKGVLIEAVSSSGSGIELSGLGLSGFLEPALMDFYCATPLAFVYIDLLERAARGERALLGIPDIAKANSGGGLDMVVHYMQRGWDLADAKWHAVGVLGHQTYVHHHRGYHLRRIMQEDWSSNREIYQSAGYRELATIPVKPASLPVGAAVLAPSRTVFFAERSEVTTRAPGSTVSYVFNYRPPRCFFTFAEQRLLILALEGQTDQDLAANLSISLSSVKNAWRGIYQKVQLEAAFVLPQGEEGDDGKRGPEKRRRVLSFVEEQPQELRPHARPPL